MERWIAVSAAVALIAMFAAVTRGCEISNRSDYYSRTTGETREQCYGRGCELLRAAPSPKGEAR